MLEDHRYVHIIIFVHLFYPKHKYGHLDSMQYFDFCLFVCFVVCFVHIVIPFLIWTWYNVSWKSYREKDERTSPGLCYLMPSFLFTLFPSMF